MKAGSLPLEAGSQKPDTPNQQLKKNYNNYEQRKKVFNP